MPVQTPKTVGIQSPWVVGSAGFSLEVGEGGRGGSRASPPLGGECPLGPQKGDVAITGVVRQHGRNRERRLQRRRAEDYAWESGICSGSKPHTLSLPVGRLDTCMVQMKNPGTMEGGCDGEG